MKYLIVALCALTVAVSVLFVSFNLDECCEYLGLLAAEGVSERPGVEHAKVEATREDGAIPDKVKGLRLNQLAGAVELPDLNNKVRRVDFAGSKFTVFVWLSSVCPTSKIYEERLNKLAADFKDVAFWAVNSDAMEGLPELRAHFLNGDKPLAFPLLKDDFNRLADRFGARVCPDVFVFDRDGKLQYRGGVDDNRNPQVVKTSFLHEVLASLLAGKNPPWRYQRPNGCCPIDRVEPVTDDKANASK